MRTRNLIALAALLSACVVAPAMAKPTPVDSTITRVTVYPEWAYVIRSAPVDLKAGSATLTFDELPAWIDSESIRVSLDNPEGIKIEGATTKTTFLARSTEEEVNKAQAKVTELADQIDDLNLELQVLKEEKQFLNGLAVFKADATPKDAAVREVSIDELAAVQKHLREQKLANAKAITTLSRQIRELRPELSAAQRAFNEVRNRIRLEQKQIIVELTAEKPAKTTIHVGYLISGASWYPAYDARTTSSSGKVDLTARAVVQQSTGEDWSDAEFTLSTIQPYLSREKPQLTPWIIGRGSMPSFQNAEAFDLSSALSNTRAGGNFESVQRLSKVQRKQLDFNANDLQAQTAYARVADNRTNLLRVVRAVEDRGTTVEFDVAGKHSVSPDGKPSELPLGQTTLDTTNHYTAAPAVSKSTYLTAQMRNTGAFPVLPGSVRIYTDGSFVAKSSLPFVAQNEKFELFLGLDERIKVTRELDYSKSSTASWSGKKRLSVAYDIEVKNYHEHAVSIDIADQLPVSEDKQIVVKVEDITPAAASQDKGIVTWSLKLAPGETKTLRFAFRVDYPPSAAVAPALDASDDFAPNQLYQLEQQIMQK